ncbi:MAG TPA: type I polyketide synthase, partial [Thermoanaerobaculia bacterium]|nr:type I polyketide synthase [Thermoanaerobaculia bacterium]
MSDYIAIVGLSGRFPGAENADAFWRNLRDGVESIATFEERPGYVPRGGALDGIELFDARFFGYSPREAELMDPQQRLFLEESWKALEDAGIDPARPPGRIGVFAGTGLPSYLLDHVYPHRETIDDFQAAVANDKDFLATRISYKLDLRGPGLTVQTACSTSLVAVSLACQSLMNGDCDAALAGGVTVRLPHRTGYVHVEEGILSPDGHCRAFDAEARGTVPGSGVGVIVLKRLSDALKDGDEIRAVIRGWALNNDGGGKAGYTAPLTEGQATVIQEALALAEVEPETVSYVEAHGTGTRLGDPIEVAALRRAFEGAESCWLGSVKTNIGHLDCAAGVTGLIKTVLALQHREIPPTLHYRTPNPEIDFGPFRVVDRLTEWRSAGPRRAGVSSFGIGGTNAHVVLEEAPSSVLPRSAGEEAPALLMLSAKTPSALETVTENLVRHLEDRPELDLRDVAFTLQTGRQPLEVRRAAVVQDRSNVSWITGQPEPGYRPVAFLFPGQGAQHEGMAAELREPVFLRELDRCSSILGRDLLAGDVRQTELAQPALFAVEWALAQLWMDWGVQPEALLGHSVGEYVAAALAGVFSLEDALSLVAERGRLVQATQPGAMLSVPLSEEELAPWLADGELSLAAVNGPDLCAVSGSFEAIERLEAKLPASRRLHTSHAFHSVLVEPAMAPFRERVARVRLQPPRIPFLSNVTGTWITAEEATDPDYWARHLRQPVRFAPAVAALLSEPRRLLLEVGPGTTLTTLVRRGGEARDRIVSSLPHPQDSETDTQALLGAAGRLWLAGVPLQTESSGRKVALPAYPFEGQRYWIDGGASPKPSTLGKRPDPADWLYLPTWKRTLPAGALSAAEEGDVWIVSDGHELGKRLQGTLREAASEEEVEATVAGLLDDGPPRLVVFLGDAPGLLALSRELGRRVHSPVQLAVVTRGLYEVTGGEASGEGGALAGLARVIPQEYPNLRCRLIDVAGLDEAGALAAELETDGPAVVALRGRLRWEQVYEPVRLERKEGLRPDGHYVITGGSGRFGQLIEGTRITRLDLKEGVDVADRAAVVRALREAVARHGRIDGILHAAGEPSDDYRTLSELSAADLDRHLRPKVGGAIALREALRELGEEPAFCIATSSLAAVLGGVSLGAHAAADAA